MESILSTLFAPDLHQKTNLLSKQGDSINKGAVPKVNGTAPSSISSMDPAGFESSAWRIKVQK